MPASSSNPYPPTFSPSSFPFFSSSLSLPVMDTTSLPGNQQNPIPSAPSKGSGSIGPFIAVMLVIIVLCALSCFSGRYCGPQAEGPDSRYDCLGWFRRRYSCHRRAVAMDMDPKVRESNQLSLPSPQPMNQ